VNWSKVGTIAASWIVSPVLAGTISYMLFKSVQRLILDTEAPFENAKRYVPVYMFMVGFMITMVTLIKGLKHVLKDIGFTLNYFEMSLVAAAAGILVSIVGSIMLTRVKRI